MSIVPFYPPDTLLDNIQTLIKKRVLETPNDTAFLFKNKYDTIVCWNWSNVKKLILKTVSNLEIYGVRSGSKVAILLNNTPQWEIIHWSLLWIGAEVIGLELNYKIEKIKYIIENSEIQFCVIEGDIFSKISEIGINQLIKIEEKIGTLEAWNALLKKENEVFSGNQKLAGINADIKMDSDQIQLSKNIATHIYTSGTTGFPKKYLYTQGQLCEAVKVMSKVFAELKPGQKTVSWLPLANLFQRITNLLSVECGLIICFVENPTQIISELKWIQPQFFIGVPRIFEKIHLKFNEKIKVPQFFLFLSESFSELKKKNSYKNILLFPFYKTIDYLIFRKIRLLFGENLIFAISGSAPLSIEILYFFKACNILILEAYGMSENILPITLSTPNEYKFGFVGKATLKNSIAINDSEKVAVNNFGLHIGASLENNWFETGDIGTLDQDQFLRLRGRNSEFVKTSTGKRFSVVPIEQKIKEFEFIDHALVVGDGLKYLVAILDLNSENINNKDVKYLNIKLKEQFYILNSKIESPILGVIIVDHSFSIKTGELTENLKLKRSFIINKYKYEVNQLIEKIDKNKDDIYQGEKSTESVYIKNLQQNNINLVQNFDYKSNMKFKTCTILRSFHLIYYFLKMLPYFLLLLLDKNNKDLNSRIRIHIAKILRHSLTPLKGPLYKIGHVFSNSGLAHPALQELLSPLLIKNPFLSFNQIKNLVEKELKSDLLDIFSEFAERPLAVGNISQVHYAKLKSGEDVVVKVKTPDIEKLIHSDLKILRYFSFFGSIFSPIKNLQEIEKKLNFMLLRETDFLEEAKEMVFFSNYFNDKGRVYIPRVFHKFSTKSILISEYIPGPNLNEFIQTATSHAKNYISSTLWNYASESINILHRFNSDPDPENFIIIDSDSDNPRLGIIDFGFVSHWSLDFIKIWQQQTYSAIVKDIELFQDSCFRLQIFKKKQDPRTYELMDIFHDIVYSPWIKDRIFKFDQNFLQKELNAIYQFFMSGGSIKVPPDFIGVFRLFWGLHIIMVNLEAEANWHKESLHIILSTISEEKINRINNKP